MTTWAECTTCDGSGEVWTGRNELDTNAPITVVCPDCDGFGDRPTDADMPADEESR